MTLPIWTASQLVWLAGEGWTASEVARLTADMIERECATEGCTEVPAAGEQRCAGCFEMGLDTLRDAYDRARDTPGKRTSPRI